MAKYLGEVLVDIKDTGFKDYTPTDWAMYYIGSYGQIDGEHHKLWVMDQVARILKGSPIEVKQASWSDGTKEYRVEILGPSQEYKDWVLEMKGEYSEDDECYEYGYDEGIAP